jgi:hypothetical protein
MQNDIRYKNGLLSVVSQGTYATKIREQFTIGGRLDKLN